MKIPEIMNVNQIIQIINKYSQKFLPVKLAGLIEKYLSPEIVRYLLVGSTTVLVFMLASSLMYYLIPHTIIATILGWVIGTVYSYFSHMLLTFKVQVKHKTYIPKYILLTLISFIYNISGAWLLHDIMNIGYAISIFILSLIWPIVSYLIMKFFIFKNDGAT